MYVCLQEGRITMKNDAKIGLLKWEGGKVPRSLMQLEELQGNSTNPSSYRFPIRMEEVPGATTETIITNPSQEVLAHCIDIAKQMETDGIKAITTSCGFNAIFQRELANAVNIPVFTSSLLQIPFVQQIIGSDNTVGVVTASKSNLSKKHLEYCGITDDMNVKIFGLENCVQFGKLFTDPDGDVDMGIIEQEIVGTAIDAVKENSDIKAIVLECTDLPPFARKISEATGLPVFDIITLINYVAFSVGAISLYE